MQRTINVETMLGGSLIYSGSEPRWGINTTANEFWKWNFEGSYKWEHFLDSAPYPLQYITEVNGGLPLQNSHCWQQSWAFTALQLEASLSTDAPSKFSEGYNHQ